jgi:hypothetical protein
VLGALLALGLGGCRTTTDSARVAASPAVVEEPAAVCADTTQEVPLPLARRDSLGPVGMRATGASIDDVFAAIALEHPGGFGGTYLDSGRTVLRFTDTTAARAALGPINVRLATYFRGSFDTTAVRLVPSRWSFATMYDWYGYLFPRVFGPYGYGVHMADVNEARNRVMFMTQATDQLPRLRAALDAVGTPCGLVVLRVEPVSQLVPGRSP